MKSRLFVLSLLATSFLVNGLRAAETAEQIIAKARSFLGSEAALQGVKTVHFTGKLDGIERVPNEGDATKFTERKVQFPIEIVFQKPFQQRIILTRPNVVETTALDGYEGWQRRANPQNLTQWQLTLLDPRQIKRLRANTWENLNFFAGIEKSGGTVTIIGDATVDGKSCTKLSFDHGSEIVFIRYFDKATGRLIKTETDNGGEIREEGEIVVGGVRFPKTVINKSANGQTTTITFEKAVLNEPVPAKEFEVPAFQSAAGN